MPPHGNGSEIRLAATPHTGIPSENNKLPSVSVIPCPTFKLSPWSRNMSRSIKISLPRRYTHLAHKKLSLIIIGVFGGTLIGSYYVRLGIEANYTPYRSYKTSDIPETIVSSARYAFECPIQYLLAGTSQRFQYRGADQGNNNTKPDFFFSVMTRFNGVLHRKVQISAPVLRKMIYIHSRWLIDNLYFLVSASESSIPLNLTITKPL